MRRMEVRSDAYRSQIQGEEDHTSRADQAINTCAAGIEELGRKLVSMIVSQSKNKKPRLPLPFCDTEEVIVNAADYERDEANDILVHIPADTEGFTALTTIDITLKKLSTSDTPVDLLECWIDWPPTEQPLADASAAEVVWLYGLRMWVEQSYKQVKHALGWSAYQVRTDTAIRRHWQLVCCAFSFCWGAYGLLPTDDGEQSAEYPEGDLPDWPARKERKQALVGVLVGGVEDGEGVAGTVVDAVALLKSVLRSAPAEGAKSAA